MHAPGSRGYEDYEELGRRIIAAQEASSQVAALIMHMWPVEAEDRRPLPSQYDDEMLRRTLDLNELVSQLSLEFHAEIPESEVPPGKPRTPPPFDRQDV
jgi:hypothetical protein